MINKYKVFGILSEIRRCLPVTAPDRYNQKERMAFYDGWHQCARHFEDQTINTIERELGK